MKANTEMWISFVTVGLLIFMFGFTAGRIFQKYSNPASKNIEVETVKIIINKVERK